MSMTNLSELQPNQANDYLIAVWELVKGYLVLPGAVHSTPRFRESVIFIGRNSKYDFWLGASGRLYRDYEILKLRKRKVTKITVDSAARSLGGSRNSLANSIAISAAEWAKRSLSGSLPPLIPTPSPKTVFEFIFGLLKASTAEVAS